jgi:secreted trypsin-like serine protease
MRTWSRVALLVSLGLAAGCSLSAADESPELGESSAAVVGGTPTTGYPAVALLYSEFSEADGAQLCSGTLISPRVIMTAAHCVEFPDGDPTTYLAYFGANITTQSDPQRIGTVDIVDYIANPDWNIDDLEAGRDIGLVLLARPAPVQPMRFNRNPIDQLVGQQVHLVGWGRTSGEGEDYGIKREAMSSLQAADGQLMQYGSASANTCQGDSGGPNFMTIGGEEVVAGITSFGNVGCDQVGFGTRVDVHAESFIDPFVADNDPDAVPVDPGDDPGDGDGGSDEPGGSGPAAPVSGGCGAGGPTGPVGFTLVLLLTLAVMTPALRRRPAPGSARRR